MPSIVIFNTGNDRLINFLTSVNAPDYQGRPDVLIFDNTTTPHEDTVKAFIESRLRKYLKVSGGDVVEMSQVEKDAVDAEIDSAYDLEVRTGAKALTDGFVDLPLLLRAVADIVKDEINLLRQRDRDRSTDIAASTTLANLKTAWAARASLTDRTLTQLKTAIKARIDSQTIDEK